MSRYMQRYVGEYRVVAEYDQSTNDFVRDDDGNIDSSFDDLYIPCKNGGRILYKGRGVLQYYIGSKRRGANIIKKIKENSDVYSLILDIDYTDCEMAFCFNAGDLGAFQPFISPKTYGSNILPFSSRNLPRTHYKIPKCDNDKYKAIVMDLYSDAPLMIAKVIKDYINTITVDGTGGNVAKKRMCLGNKEFIHKIGLWDEFLNLLEQKGLGFKNEKNGKV